MDFTMIIQAYNKGENTALATYATLWSHFDDEDEAWCAAAWIQEMLDTDKMEDFDPILLQFSSTWNHRLGDDAEFFVFVEPSAANLPTELDTVH